MNPAKGKKDEVAAVTADELRSQLILKKLVGRGGFAAVYLGTYKGQEVAVKIILAEHVTPNSPQVKLFLREGQYMSRCTHRSIVKCHAICQLPADFPGMEALGHKNATWALVLEHIPGGSLAALLMKQMAQTRPTYSDYEAYCWVVDVADALHYMHNAPRPVMHRDVKADNVLLTMDESGRPTAKLLDFGLMAALDGKNPMLRRRSVSPAEGLGRGSTASIARGSVGSNSGAGRGNLASPSVATYYNDSTHEPGKIFYLMDELPQATVAALPGPGGSRRPSVDLGAGAAGGMNLAAFATAANVAGLGGSTSPNTQFGFNVAASSRESSLEGGGATGGAAPAGAAGAASGLPWGGASRHGSRSGTGNGASPGVPGFGTLVPLNEEASFHGNTAGYAAMLLHQQQHQQQQQQRRAQRRASGDATVAAPAAAVTGRGGSTGALHSSLHGLVGVGGDSASGAPGGSLPNSLHGKGSIDSSGIEGSSPVDSPLASGKWQVDGLGAGSVRLRVDTDDITPARPHTLAGGIGGDAAIVAAAAAMIGSAPAPGLPGGPGSKMGSRRVSDDANGSLVRMSAQVVAVPPIEPKAALEAELPPGDDADLILRSATPLPPPPSHTTPRPSMDASGRPMSANKMAAGDVTSAEGLPVTPMHPPMPQVHATPVSGTASARAGSHDAVPAVDVAGVAPRTGSITDGTGAAGSNRKRLACTSASVPGTQTPPQGCSTPSLSLVEQQQQQERATCGAVLARAAPAMKGTPPVMLTDCGATSGPLLKNPLQKSLGAGSDPFARQSAGAGGGGVSAPQFAQRPAGCNRGSSGFANTPEGGGGVVSISAVLQGRYEQDFQWVWRLTGQTGSCMYMAPEVFRGLPYNEKVDVFSFGVLVYEVFSRTLTLIAGLNLRDLRMRMMDTPEGYAEYVAGGYRPSKPLAMPEPLFELISACWSEDPCNRPSMAEVVESLEALQQQYAPSPKTEAPTSACGCIIS